MDIGLVISNYRKNLMGRMEDLNKKIKTFPSGEIQVHKNGNNFKIFYSTKGRKPRYLSKDEKKLKDQMIYKTWCIKELEKLKLEDSILKDYMDVKNSVANVSNKKLQREEAVRDFFMSKIKEWEDIHCDKYVKEWKNQKYQKNEKYPEALIVKGPNGEMFRSKSEAIIANELFLSGIPYRYECELDVNGAIIYPDFTILHPARHEVIIWEHFGMIDSTEYLDNMLFKIRGYIKAGYIPQQNLLMTYETSEQPLDMNIVKDMVRSFFC